MNQSGNRRVLAFTILCLACVLTVVVFVFVSRHRERAQATSNPIAGNDILPASQAPAASPVSKALSPQPLPETKAPSTTAVPTPPVQAESAARLLYFRNNALGPEYGKLATVDLADLPHRRYSNGLVCDRVYFAGGEGVCLTADRGIFTKYYAVQFDKHLRPQRTLTVGGEPSRARVSPSGRFAAITVFISGHSYTSLAFSTQTTIVDMATGKTLVDLEQLAVTRDGKPWKSPDFNYWGVTFVHGDDNRFYATLWSAAHTYLVECDLAKRAVQVLHEGVECPSLSPDNTRIAFKKRTPSPRIEWRITLLDLKTMAETPLGETRSVDDQVEWLDNDHILYALSESQDGSSASTDIWELPAKADGSPRLFLKGAFSPAVAPAVGL